MNASLKVAYSQQYTTITREGHEHPPPTFGAPTLVWHLGLSPHWPARQATQDQTLEEIHEQLAKTYETTRTAFFGEVNRLLQALQRAAGFPLGTAKTFDAEHVPAPWQKPRAKEWEPFYVATPGSIRFTLWWSDTDSKPSPQPGPDALRVKVLASAHRDYVTLSFYLDAAKPWDRPPTAAGASVVGIRRKRILDHVDRVRSICEARLVAGSQGECAVDREVLPEHAVSPQDAAALLGASQYLYGDLWDDFCKAMGLHSIAAAETARIFASFRGLVMSTDGLKETGEQSRYPGSSGAKPFPRFVGNGGIDHTGTRSSDQANEANAVVKAFWPFVRRVTPEADQKELVACGVMNWRALYVTALNSAPSYDWQEEAKGPDTEVPAGHLPTPRKDAEGKPALESIRYLVLSKGEPHRRQIGRIVERINSMGTMRLIALRDYSIIRDASTQIQLRGQELDTMMRRWSTGRAKLRKEFRDRKQGKSDVEKVPIQDEENAAIQLLADEVERDLIDLSAAIDTVGERADHGLHFRINRSRYYVAEFESLLATLRIGNIETWVAYDQFVTRGLKPAFDFIDGVGHRLLGLRARLQSVLEGIETSALVRQSAATRENTEQLRNITNAFARLQQWLRIAGLVLALVSLAISVVKYQWFLDWLQIR